MKNDWIDEFIAAQMKQKGKFSPARLQAALALLEKLRTDPSLNLADHKTPNSSGLTSHEKWGNLAHTRFNLTPVNKNHGRRSNDIGGWGPILLAHLRASGFDDPKNRSAILDSAQEAIAAAIRQILETSPLEGRVKGRSAEAVIRDVMGQAEERGKSGDVAQYLVAAKLMLRLGRPIPVVQSNKGDRKSHGDRDARTGDFEIENVTIEVAVGIPDDKHLNQVVDALEDTDLEVWLLTRHDRVETWRRELEALGGVDMKRVIVSSVESFVGQNITEMGGFSTTGKASQLEQLFALYNERWVTAVGTPAIRIEIVG